MKRFLFILTFFFSIPLLGYAAEGTISVTVRIETESRTIFSNMVSVGECTVMVDGAPQSFLNHEAVCALDAAAQAGGFSYTVIDGGIGLYLTTIDNETEDYFNFWLYWINYSLAQVGVGNQLLTNGDNILFALTSSENIPLTMNAPSTAISGEPFTIESLTFDAGQQAFVPLADATIRVGADTFLSDANGQTTVTLNEPGTYQLMAEKPGYVRSPVEILTVTAAPLPPAEPPAPPIEPVPIEPTPGPITPDTTSPEPTDIPDDSLEETTEETTDSTNERENKINEPAEPPSTTSLATVIKPATSLTPVPVPSIVRSQPTPLQVKPSVNESNNRLAISTDIQPPLALYEIPQPENTKPPRKTVERFLFERRWTIFTFCVGLSGLIVTSWFRPRTTLANRKQPE